MRNKPKANKREVIQGSEISETWENTKTIEKIMKLKVDFLKDQYN